MSYNVKKLCLTVSHLLLLIRNNHKKTQHQNEDIGTFYAQLKLKKLLGNKLSGPVLQRFHNLRTMERINKT